MIEILLQAENALQLGLLDQAERRYWRVLESDPANAIAIVGLGRVALERSDERTALAFGRKALGTDPENSVARRLVDRLEEVIRERGDVVPAESLSAQRPAAESPSASPAAEPPLAEPEGPPGQPGPAAQSAPLAQTASTEPSPSAGPSSSPEPSGLPAPRARRGLLDRLLGRP